MMSFTTITVRNVDKEIYERFKIKVVKRRKKLHGVVGEELSHAMKSYVSQGDTFLDEKIKKISHSATEKKLTALKDRFCKDGDSSVFQSMTVSKTNVSEFNKIPVSVFFKYTKDIIGLTNTTQEKYLQLFCEKHNITLLGSKGKGTKGRDNRFMVRYLEDLPI